MKKIVFLTFLTILTFSLFAQRFHDFSIGINHPIKYSEPSTFRKAGLDFGFGFGKRFPNNLSYEFNFAVSGWSRINYNYKYSESFTSPEVTKKGSRISSDILISLFIGYKINKFDIKSGFAYCIKNFYIGSNDYSYNPYWNYEKESLFYPEDWDKMISIDFRIRVIYDVNRKINPFIDFKTKIKNVWNVRPSPNGYGILTIGVVYIIARR